MKVNWIIEKYIFSEYEKQLSDIIISGNNNCLIVDDTKINFNFNKDIKNKFSEKDCVIFYGSLQRGRQVWRETNFIPGIFLTIDNYECFKYYGYYGDNLLNSDYLLIGLNDIPRKKDFLFKTFKTDKIFIRPSNGYKTFSGQLLSYDDFEKEFDILCKSYGGINMDQLVLVSSEKKVREENRYIVMNENGINKVVDGNTYMINGEIVNDRIFDEKSLDFLNNIINNYTPDKVFTIDIAKMDDNKYSILEIGSFCCAGWYNMNLEKVVKDINELCSKEYKKYQSII